jgi:amidase
MRTAIEPFHVLRQPPGRPRPAFAEEALVVRDALHARRLRVSEVTDAALQRITALDQTLKAFVTVAGDSATETAARLDREGPRDRPLFGLPLAVKDLLDTAGLRTTHGSLAYETHVPSIDDIVVARARQAGAVVVGKTNTPEFGFGAVCSNALCGPTANPLDPRLTSGGSSGGSAVAVATGMAALALGTDYGGSVRVPAAFCGVVGFRPTPGRFPALGRQLASDALSTTGCLVRSARDARLLFEATEGPDERDPLSLRAWPPRSPAPAQPRVAVTLDFGIAPISSAVRSAFYHAVAAIQSAVGNPVTHAYPDCTGARDSFGTMRAANIHFNLAPVRDALGARMSPTVRWNIERGDGISAATYLAAEAKRFEITARFVEFFKNYDFLVSPSAAILPFPHEAGEVLTIDGERLESLTDYFTVTFIISLVGCPAISIPFWPKGESLPIGLQLVAPPGADYPLLDFAEELEERFGTPERG